MKSYSLIIGVFLVCCVMYAQETNLAEIDSLYREDQFYAGITYNLIANKPSGLSQNRFSIGTKFGCLRDMPINKKRNISIALGVGYAFNSFNQNLLINKDESGEEVYTVLTDNSTYIKNRFFTHLVEIPLEFRWRTSTPETYSFWRIYTGVKVGYLFASNSKYVGDLGTLKYANIRGFNRFQYGLFTSAGYNTWNFYIYYALNPLFSEDRKIDGETSNMKTINFGIMFYIL